MEDKEEDFKTPTRRRSEGAAVSPQLMGTPPAKDKAPPPRPMTPFVRPSSRGTQTFAGDVVQESTRPKSPFSGLSIIPEIRLENVLSSDDNNGGDDNQLELSRGSASSHENSHLLDVSSKSSGMFDMSGDMSSIDLDWYEMLHREYLIMREVNHTTGYPFYACAYLVELGRGDWTIITLVTTPNITRTIFLIIMLGCIYIDTFITK